MHPIRSVLVTCLAAGACGPATATHGKAPSRADLASGMPALPAPGGTGVLTPWGGDDAAHCANSKERLSWRPISPRSP